MLEGEAAEWEEVRGLEGAVFVAMTKDWNGWSAGLERVLRLQAMCLVDTVIG